MVKRKFAADSRPHPVDVHVGRRIRALRVDRRLSLEALADGVGLSYQQIQKYEKGANRVSASMLYDIAVFLEAEIETFFGGYAAPLAK